MSRDKLSPPSNRILPQPYDVSSLRRSRSNISWHEQALSGCVPPDILYIYCFPTSTSRMTSQCFGQVLDKETFGRCQLQRVRERGLGSKAYC